MSVFEIRCSVVYVGTGSWVLEGYIAHATSANATPMTANTTGVKSFFRNSQFLGGAS